MRLLVVSNGFPPRGGYGTEFYTGELVRGLLARGHEVHVLHPDRSGARTRYSVEHVREEGVDLHLIANPGDPSKRFAPSYEDPEVERVFGALLDDLRPDLVHFTYLLWGLSVRLPAVARARSIPSVLTLTDYGLVCHKGQLYDDRLVRCGGPHPAAVCARCVRTPSRYDLAPLPRLLKRATAEALALVGGLGRVAVPADLERREEHVRAAMRCVARVIAPTEVVAEVFERWGGLARAPERLVYAFETAPYEAAREAAAPTPPVFGFLGQFGPHKGLATLVEAARLLDLERPDAAWRVRLYGAPAPRHARYAPAVLAAADARRVERGEAFPPERAPAVLAGLSALCLPAEWDENAPLSVLQARAVGVPVLASDVAGIREVIEDGVHGRLVPVGDAAALARAMGEVLDGRLARGAAPGLPLSMSAHLDRLEALYGEVLAEECA